MYSPSAYTSLYISTHFSLVPCVPPIVAQIELTSVRNKAKQILTLNQSHAWRNRTFPPFSRGCNTTIAIHNPS